MEKFIKIIKIISQIPMIPMFFGISISRLLFYHQTNFYWILIFIITLLFTIVFFLIIFEKFDKLVSKISFFISNLKNKNS